jgi:hypothetical protein
MQKYVLFILLLSGSIAAIQAQSLGDVNISDKIDILDALAVARYVIGLNPSVFNPAFADVNCSAAIDVIDALLIAKFSAGLINTFPCTITPTPRFVYGALP